MQQSSYIFVLWGSRFESVPTVIFVTTLRKIGFQTKLLGLHSQHITGTSGITLVPDLTVTKALPLAHRTSCVIIPYSDPDIKCRVNDPRIHQFLRQANENNAKFVVGQLDNADIGGLGMCPELTDRFIRYPDHGLSGFALDLAASLSD